MEFCFENVTITDSEFWEIKKFFTFRVRKMVKKILLLLISLALGLLSSYLLSESVIFYLFLSFIIFYLLYYFLRSYLLSYLKFKKAKTQNITQTMIFNKDGIKVRLNSTNTKLIGVDVEVEKFDLKYTWENVKRIIESDAFFFFIYSPKIQWILPKRLFENSDQEMQFVKIVDKNCRIYIQKL